MKSTKSSSLLLRTEARVREEGRRRLPLALTNGRGAPVASDDQLDLGRRVRGLTKE
jgi:hypothetical protein